VEERVGEGEGDEAGGLDLLQPLQLRAQRHRTQPLRLPPASSQEGFAAARVNGGTFSTRCIAGQQVSEK
jgi:hypothetical protein